MVQSKIDKTINYPETKDLNEEDKDYDADLFEISLFNEDIIIELKESYWKQESVMRRFDLMYHELGHDALNLKHVCNRYDIMYTSTVNLMKVVEKTSI